jgi:chemotaxis protein methyltransferase CheR
LNIKIIATDINRRFLKKAAEGIYTKWSFREKVDNIQKKYFRITGDGRFQLVPEIRSMVDFSF